MGGSREGGLYAARTNRWKYGPDFYKEIGAKGGRKSRGGGFAKGLVCDCELVEGRHKLARCAGKKGGTNSRRGPAKPIKKRSFLERMLHGR